MLHDRTFLASLQSKVASIATYGASNGIAQKLVQLAAPGVPDTYQGSETWDLRLVDPDNRRPIDYGALRALLRDVEGAKPRALLDSFADGRIKLHVVRAALSVRRSLPAVFLDGDYVPLAAADEIFAFRRAHAENEVVCAVVCRPHGVTEGRSPWPIADTLGERTVDLPPGRWRDALTGRELTTTEEPTMASRVFADLPVALLVKT
jgi:(1->4)-alpha-D-glucan 1-alpha-D-glucosylmutase